MTGRPRTPRPQKQSKIDRDKLHRYLYHQANPRSHQLPVSNTKLATLLGVRSDHMGRILAEMVRQGRLRKVAIGRHRIATYEITDPVVWGGGVAAPAKPARRELKWQ